MTFVRLFFPQAPATIAKNRVEGTGASFESTTYNSLR